MCVEKYFNQVSRLANAENGDIYTCLYGVDESIIFNFVVEL